MQSPIKTFEVGGPLAAESLYLGEERCCYSVIMPSLLGKTQKEKDQLQKQFQGVTAATSADAVKILKKANWNLERAIEYFYADPVAQRNATAQSSSSSNDKKLGEIWEKYKDASSDPPLITIEGTMELCGDLDIDPENDPVLFCLASDLGSKAVGEWPKEGWVSGWKNISPSVDSIEKMKAQLPKLRKKLNSDPGYFKKVYGHVFTLSLAPGARTLALDQALSYWQVLIPPALASDPSALSHIDPQTRETSAPQFTDEHLALWLDFQKEKNKAVSKDTWTLFIDFVRQIDADFKEHDETGAWPSTIDDFVEYVRAKKA